MKNLKIKKITATAALALSIFGVGLAGAKTADAQIFHQYNHIPGKNFSSDWQYGYWKDGNLPWENHSNFLINNNGVGSIARVTNGINLDSGDVRAKYGWAYAHVTDSPIGSEKFYSWYFYF